jgi:hypothetical protein
MKSLRSIALIGLVAGALFSCNKSNNSTPNANTTDEAADLVTASLSVNTQGSLNSFNDVTVSAETRVNIDSLCGTVWADSVKRSVPAVPGSNISYSYDAKYSYALNCTNGVFNDSATITSSYSGSFSNTALASTFAGNSNFTVGGLGRNFTAYTINGQYNRSGSFQSKTDTTYSGTESIAITLNNIAVTKPLLTIKSGNATFTISGNMPKRGAFNFTGNIVFNGGYNATLTINGTVYTINLATGEKKKM